MDRNLTFSFRFRLSVVALRKESVDRNGGLMSVVRFATSSLSARRAWIEIAKVAALDQIADRRSPQGERG